MLTYKKWSEMSLEELTALWNRGFEGYFTKMSMTLEQFLKRSVNEELSFENSLAVFEGGQPVGFVGNCFRKENGMKIAWNGGTGIVPEYRGKGVGFALMQKNIELYQSEGVQLATLEALVQNERAIKLYEKSGYKIIDKVDYWHYAEPMTEDAFQSEPTDRYSISIGMPRDAAALSFHRPFIPWQSQWPSAKDGESLFVRDSAGTIVGYAVYKRGYDDAGSLKSIALHQCEVLPGREDEEAIVRRALREAFRPLSTTCYRLAINLRQSNEAVVRALQEAGFGVMVEQVYMTREF